MVTGFFGLLFWPFAAMPLHNAVAKRKNDSLRRTKL